MVAVIETGGKQYRVRPGDVLEVEKVPGEAGDKVRLEKVLSVGEGVDLRVGSPVLDDVAVEAEIVGHFRGKKLVVFKMKRRKGYRKKSGHRQDLTRLRVLSVGGESASSSDLVEEGAVDEEVKDSASAAVAAGVELSMEEGGDE